MSNSLRISTLLFLCGSSWSVHSKSSLVLALPILYQPTQNDSVRQNRIEADVTVMSRHSKRMGEAYVTLG